jgi:hypothetical protein
MTTRPSTTTGPVRIHVHYSLDQHAAGQLDHCARLRGARPAGRRRAGPAFAGHRGGPRRGQGQPRPRAAQAPGGRRRRGGPLGPADHRARPGQGRSARRVSAPPPNSAHGRTRPVAGESPAPIGWPLTGLCCVTPISSGCRRPATWKSTRWPRRTPARRTRELRVNSLAAHPYLAGRRTGSRLE